MSKRVDLLATTLKDTNKNLKAVDRMLEEYKDFGEQQGVTMDRLKTDLARTSDKLKEERMKRSIRETTRGMQPADMEDDWPRDRANRLPTSPLREYSSQANDDVAQSYRGGYTRNRRAGVRFYDDMDTDDHIHVLHRSLRDLSSNQQRLERDFNRELTTRDKEEYDMKKSLQDLADVPKSSHIETAISTVDKRLQSIQDELKAERQMYRKKQEEVTRLSTDLQSALHQPAPSQPSTEDVEMRTRLMRSESQRNQDLYERRVSDAESRVALAESYRLQVESDLEKLNQRLDKAEGGREALVGQIEDYRRQLSSCDQDKQKLALLLEQQEDELKNKQRNKLLDDHDRTQMMSENQRMADELKELRSHLSKSAAVVGDYGGLQRDLDCSEKQRTQLSDHIQVLNKDLDIREKQAAKMVTQLQETMDKYEALEQSRHTTLVQLEDTLKKLQTTTQEAENLQSELVATQAQLTESENKREDIKIRAQETVKQWKLKCRRLEREVDRYTHSTQQMSERNEQLIRDMENTKTQMNLNTQHVDHARQELSDAAALRATHEEQLRMKANEIVELKSLKDSNEDELKEQRSLIEKYEFELHLASDKYSKLFDEKVSVEDQVFGIQQQGVLLQNQILQLQKDWKDVSTEKVNLASQLADAVSERQSFKHSLQDAKKLDAAARSEIDGLMLRLKEEKEYYHARAEAMKSETEESKMKDAQVMRDLTHRFKKEHAEYEAELQALKIELHELRANSKQSRKYQEKHKEEIERLHHDLVVSKEETAEAQKKYHALKEEFYNKSQVGEDGITRARELDLELLNMKEDMRKLEKDHQNVVDNLSDEINDIIEIASENAVHAYKAKLNSQLVSVDPHQWFADVKGKLSWLRSELIARQQDADKFHTDSHQETDYDRKLYITELNNHHNVLNQVSQFRKELQEKDLETSQKVGSLQEQVGLLTESLVAERDTIQSHDQLNDDLTIHDIRSERQRINDRYTRLQETVSSLKKELNDHNTVDNTNNNSNSQPKTSSMRVKNDTSPMRRSARKVHIVTPPDIDDSRPLDSLDLRSMTPPIGNDIRQQKTPPPLSLSDEEFRQKFMLAI